MTMRKVWFLLPLLLTAAITVYARCATVEIAALTPVISAGSVETISAKVANCDSKSANLHTEVMVTSACGEVKSYEISSREQSGGAVFVTIAHQVPAGACVGTYEVSAVVRVGQFVLASANSSFIVQ